MLLLALLVCLGTLAQWLAWRFRLPLLVLLLAFGAALQAVIQVPTPDLRAAVSPLLGVCLSLVFFEGGCALASRPLNHDRHLVTHLAGIGPKLGWVLMAGLAWLALRMSTLMSLTCGAFLLIGAPYLAEPMALRVGGDERLAKVLQWESFLVSCVGAAWTVLMAHAVVANAGHPSLVKTLVATTQTGIIGLAMGMSMAHLLNRWLGRVPEEMSHSVGVSAVFLAFGLAQAYYQGAGLVAAITMGYLVSFSGHRIKEPQFWASLRTLVLGILGIFLGMEIPLSDLSVEWPRHLAFALSLVILVRPLLVAIGARNCGLSRRERAVLSLVAPRGPINLACAAMVAQVLQRAGMEAEASQVMPLAYWSALVTTLVPWLLGPWIVKAYGPPAPAA